MGGWIPHPCLDDDRLKFVTEFEIFCAPPVCHRQLSAISVQFWSLLCVGSLLQVIVSNQRKSTDVWKTMDTTSYQLFFFIYKQ